MFKLNSCKSFLVQMWISYLEILDEFASEIPGIPSDGDLPEEV